ncbi:MAG: hypothetical protein QOD86_232 [Miltoncostaeaceae bacterium]|nr:hypothetical protein [Miltoncostaeaceae bacterium]
MPARRTTLSTLAAIAASAAIAILAGCGASAAAPGPAPASAAGAPVERDGMRLPARVQGEEIALGMGDRFEARFWPGVNLGSTVPGYQPGEVAATAEDYRRWFPEMAELGTRVVRVYTILAPAFYDELRAYNLAHADDPLYVIQGVWIPEERFLSGQNAYDPALVREFRAELADAVAAVHGDADRPERRGHASGRYRASIAPWLLAWSVGVEWDPFATLNTDRVNAGHPAYRGRFITTRNGPTPMESWIAENLDYLAGLEAARGWSRPVTFTNWLTVDPLDHPTEPLEQEDMVSVDAMHLAATARWPGGFFASYHAYPYYPDFLRTDPGYRSYTRPDGKVDPYAGYLHELRAHHRGQAVMITEFGQPSGIGIAHYGPLDRNQGGHSEREAATNDADMLSAIRQEGFAGGVVFEWVDEWFKFTWNTVDLEVPGDRRQLWRNALTNEEHFGVIAAEPGADGPVVTVDGDDSEWTAPGHSPVIQEGRGAIREVRATKDEEYLYLRLRLDRPLDAEHPVQVGFDVRGGGNRGLPGAPGLDPAADVALTIADGEATIRQAAWTDPIGFLYGVKHDFVDVDRADLEVGSGAWVSPRLILNRPQRVPGTGETLPTELVDVGTLPWGTADPGAEGFDDRHLIDADGEAVEVRIPWALLTFADPSSRRVLVPRADGTMDTEAIDRIGITVVRDGEVTTTAGYGLEDWNRVGWHERRKDGWDVLQSAFREAFAPVAEADAR